MSIYEKSNIEEKKSSRTLSVIVDNEPGALARVIGLFSGRGYNIESLTVTEIDKKRRLSRISLVTKGTSLTIEQIKSQLDSQNITGHENMDSALIATQMLQYPYQQDYVSNLPSSEKHPSVKNSGGGS